MTIAEVQIKKKVNAGRYKMPVLSSVKENPSPLDININIDININFKR